MSQRIEGRLGAAGSVRHCGSPKGHLDPTEGPHEAEVVEVAKVADSKDLAAELPKPHAKRHVAGPKCHLSEVICIKAAAVFAKGHAHGGEDRAVEGRRLTDKLEAPGSSS